MSHRSYPPDEDLKWAEVQAKSLAGKLPTCFPLEDLIQTAKVEMLRQWPRYDPSRGVPFRAFCCRAVRGACMMSVRGSNWRHAMMEPFQQSAPISEMEKGERKPQVAADLISADPDPEMLAQREQMAGKVRESINLLPFELARVLTLQFVLGMTIDDAATRLKIGRVKSWRMRDEGIALLRVQMREWQ